MHVKTTQDDERKDPVLLWLSDSFLMEEQKVKQIAKWQPNSKLFFFFCFPFVNGYKILNQQKQPLMNVWKQSSLDQIPFQNKRNTDAQFLGHSCFCCFQALVQKINPECATQQTL